MNLIRKHLNNKGFTLIELAIVTVITTIALSSGLWKMTQELHVKKGHVLGDQLKSVSDGVDNYLVKNYGQLVQPFPSVAGFANPMQPTVAELRSGNYVAAGVSGTNVYGGGYSINISKTPAGCLPVDCNISAVTSINAPIVKQKSGTLDTVVLGAASERIGGDAGVAYTAATLEGADGTWSVPNPTGQAGVIAVRSGFGASTYTEFYRRDGSLPLTAALSGGNQDIDNVNQVNSQSINNAGNIGTATVTASGAITSATVTASGQVRGGTVTSTGNMTAGGNVTATGSVSGSSVYASGNVVAGNMVQAGGEVRATQFRDGNTGYVVNPAGTSTVNYMDATIFRDRNNTGYYVDPASTSRVNRMMTSRVPNSNDDVTNKKYVDTKVAAGGGGGGLVKNLSPFRNQRTRRFNLRYFTPNYTSTEVFIDSNYNVYVDTFLGNGRLRDRRFYCTLKYPKLQCTGGGRYYSSSYRVYVTFTMNTEGVLIEYNSDDGQGDNNSRRWSSGRFGWQ